MSGNSSGHTILCGMGRIGVQVLTLLRRLGEPVTIITDDKRPDRREFAESIGCVVFVGDVRSESLLLKAGVGNARAIITSTEDDLTNVTVALEAMKFRPGIAVVIRLFDQQLAVQLESTLPISRALSTSAIAAPTYAAAATGEKIIASMPTHAGREAHTIEEITVEENSRWIGKMIRDLSYETNIRILALDRGGAFLHEDLDEQRLASGDDLVVMTSSRNRESSLARFSPALASNESAEPDLKSAEKPTGSRALMKHASRPFAVIAGMLACVILVSIMVFHFGMGMAPVDAYYFVMTTVTTVGYGDFNLMNASAPYKIFGTFLMLCGAALIAALFGVVTDALITARLGALLASRTLTDRNHIIVTGADHSAVRIVEELIAADQKPAFVTTKDSGGEFETMRDTAPLIVGNPRDEDTLRRAGIQNARALVAATDNDLENLSAALLAKKLNPRCRTVIRIFHSDLSDHLPMLGVDAILSTSLLAAPVFAAAALYGRVEGAFTWRDRLAVITMAGQAEYKVTWRALNPHIS